MGKKSKLIADQQAKTGMSYAAAKRAVEACAAARADNLLAAMPCHHCGAVGLVIAEAVLEHRPDGKRNVRCKTCKKAQADEIER